MCASVCVCVCVCVCLCVCICDCVCLCAQDTDLRGVCVCARAPLPSNLGWLTRPYESRMRLSRHTARGFFAHTVAAYSVSANTRAHTRTMQHSNPIMRTLTPATYTRALCCNNHAHHYARIHPPRNAQGTFQAVFALCTQVNNKTYTRRTQAEQQTRCTMRRSTCYLPSNRPRPPRTLSLHFTLVPGSNIDPLDLFQRKKKGWGGLPPFSV